MRGREVTRIQILVLINTRWHGWTVCTEAEVEREKRLARGQGFEVRVSGEVV